jgi:hypothetical protein
MLHAVLVGSVMMLLALLYWPATLGLAWRAGIPIWTVYLAVLLRQVGAILGGLLFVGTRRHAVATVPS